MPSFGQKSPSAAPLPAPELAKMIGEKAKPEGQSLEAFMTKSPDGAVTALFIRRIGNLFSWMAL